MSAAGAIARVAAMDREELRFRVASEARKVAARVRHAVRPPRPDRSQLPRVLNPAAGPLVARAVDAARRGDFLAAHRALGAHFEARSSRWPLAAIRRQQFVDTVRHRFPDETDQIRARADRILEGRQDILGYRDVRVGSPPDWHVDVIHGRRAPLAHWTRVPYLDPSIGDHKIIWEINRHQYWLTLGAAHWLTGESRYRAAFVTHLEDWIRGNPPLTGVNWASMLELAFRTLSWTWAVEFFCAGSRTDEDPWLVDLCISLDRQLTHIGENLSRYFSPNTHLSGEALALYAVSTSFPELRRSGDRIDEGRAVLLRETSRQVLPDGGHAERSAHYHRYSTDFYLLALMVARAGGDAAAAVFEESARRQSQFLRTLADDRGALPLIGDDDGGLLFRFGERGPADATPSLGAAAALLHDPSLAVGPPDADVYWILGDQPDAAGTAESVPPWPSRVLPDSGYFVSRTDDGDHLVFDAGAHGFLNGGHAHADALSVVLRVAGEPLFVDPGTATYTMDPGARDRFRSSRMHNTVVLDGRDHGEPDGPFHWRTWTDARMLVARGTPRLDFAVGTHPAYAPRRHMRAVLAFHGLGWLILDRITGTGAITADAWWHLHPAWRAHLCDGGVALCSTSGMRLAFASTAPRLTLLTDDELAVFAPEYGRVERSAAIRASRTGPGPFLIGTFVATPDMSNTAATLVEVADARSPGSNWVAVRLRIHAGGREFVAEVAFPADPEAQPSPIDWPQPCIGEPAGNVVPPRKNDSICVE